MSDPPTRWQIRRFNIMGEHWLKFHGDVNRPRFQARQARKALGGHR